MSRRGLTLAALVSIVAITSACSTSAPSSAAPTAGDQPASPSPAARANPLALLPQGTFTATIPSGVNAAPGEWKLSVSADGLWFTHPDGHGFRPGSVEELTATDLVLTPDPACPVQEGTPTSGHYRWSVEGTSLTLEVISDSCQDRIDTLTSDVWSLSQ